MARITIDNIDLLDVSIGNFKVWQIRVGILILLLNIVVISNKIGSEFLIPPTELLCKPQAKGYNKPFFDYASCFLQRKEKVKDRIQNSANDCDKSAIHTSVLHEWNLLDKKEEFSNWLQILITTGTGIGSALFGRIADLYGRHQTIVLLIVLQSFCGIILVVQSSYVGFLSLNMIGSIFIGGLSVSAWVMGIEVISKSFRTYFSAFYNIIFGLTCIIFAELGCYLIRWREFQLVLAAISILYLSYFWLLSESPRWLVVNDRRNEAIRVLKNAASPSDINQSTVDEMCNVYKEETVSAFDVFTNPQLTPRTIILSSLWLILGLLWKGLFQFVGKDFNNPYDFALIQGVFVLCAAVLCALMGYSCGRNLQCSVGVFFTAICYFAIYTISDSWSNFILSQLGFLCLSVTIPSLWVFTSELYPTNLRCTGVGFTVMFFQVGIILAPIITFLTTLTWLLPFLLFAMLVVLYCYLQMHLTDMKDENLPNIISDTVGEYTPF
ncbi:hypothetical protein FQA39_LY17125 [Lamprigera yunnana]|nr:hypothetical protein FQA39_LY17125 [Lamprigera yunnana]